MVDSSEDIVKVRVMSSSSEEEEAREVVAWLH